MTIELRMLALSIVLGFVHIILVSHAKGRVYGYRWSAGCSRRPSSARILPIATTR
jgi:hypothetical protein